MQMNSHNSMRSSSKLDGTMNLFWRLQCPIHLSRSSPDRVKYHMVIRHLLRLLDTLLDPHRLIRSSISVNDRKVCIDAQINRHDAYGIKRPSLSNLALLLTMELTRYKRILQLPSPQIHEAVLPLGPSFSFRSSQMPIRPHIILRNPPMIILKN